MENDVPAKKTMVLRKMLTVVLVLVIVHATLTAALFTLMLQGPDRFARAMRYVPWAAFVVLPFKPLWNVARAGRHSVGEMAPDFSLDGVDHKSTVRLSSFRGQKPVILVFGSYT